MSKTRITFYLSSVVIERARDAAYWTQNATLSQLVEEALVKSLDALEAERGEPFPRRLAELAKGRPQRR